MDNSLDMDMDGSLNRSLTNSQIYDGEFFEIVGSEGEILVVRCNICTPDGNDGQLLRTSVKSNGNILKHIKRRHEELLEKIKAAKSVKSRAPRAIKRGMMSMDDTKPFKKKMVQIKVKKQHDDELLDDGETQVYITNEDGDSMQTNQDLYLIEPVDGITESDNDEYVEFEIDGNKCEDRGSGDVSGGVASIDEINDENSLLTAPEFEYVSHRSAKPAAKRLRESTVVTPHEFTTSTTYKRVSSGGSGCGSGSDRSLIEFQKKLMQAEFDHKRKLRDEKHLLERAEFDHMKKLRDEKHQLEIAILKADLTHKTLEHQKQMELLNEKLQD